MNLGVFEDGGYKNLLPLTWMRACFELRCGRDRLIDKMETHFGSRVAQVWVRRSVRDVVVERIDLAPADAAKNWLLVNARAMLTGDIVLPPQSGVVWKRDGVLVAASVPSSDLEGVDAGLFLDEKRLDKWLADFRVEAAPERIRIITYPWDLPLANGAEIARQCRSGGVCEGKVYPGAHLLNPGAIHIAAEAVVKPGVVLDAENGPIQIDGGTVLEPNAVIVGPCYIGPRSIIRAGTSIRGDTTIGPVCKVGGEIEASIIHGYTNKQHDGFLGHSYLGQWINLGADTVTSDLKNTYGTIRAMINGVGVETGRHFVGSIIGDHAKTGIGTILPTGCIVGAGSNVFTQRAVPKFVPSFAWLTDAGMTHYRIEKAINIARTVMARRDVHLSDAEKGLIEYVAKAAREVEAAGWA